MLKFLAYLRINAKKTSFVSEPLYNQVPEMCYNYAVKKAALELQKRFKAQYAEIAIEPTVYNGFAFPKAPVIANTKPDTIQLFDWGLLPSWAKDMSFRKNTLNARIESIHEKPSFRNSANKRCLVLADAFYEWKWLDEKGKKKEKYEIRVPSGDTFAMGGIWSEYTDKETGEILHTFAILTMEANPLMAEIHNTKKRMPLILSPENEQRWLMGGAADEKINLVASVFGGTT